MQVYIVWCVNGYGNKAIYAVARTAEKAEEICKRENTNQYRYDNCYYYSVHEVE